MKYEAVQIDLRMWMVHRFDDDSEVWKDEQLMNDMPDGATPEQVISAAVNRDSWA